MVATLLLMTLGGALAPVLTGLVIAFLLQGVVGRLQQWQVTRLVAVTVHFYYYRRRVDAVLTGRTFVMAAIAKPAASAA